MSRYDKETIRAKIEWEGQDGIEWFTPSEVPEELEGLWNRALIAKDIFDGLMDAIMEELEYDDEV
jgi:hypothetical protein